MEIETVLCNVIRRMKDNKQGIYEVDNETVQLCEKELDYCLGEATSNCNGATVTKFLRYMKDGQLTQAKQLSADAFDEYKIIQAYILRKIPTEFELRYLDRLPKEKQAGVLKSPVANANEEISTTSKQQGKHTSKIQIGPQTPADAKAKQKQTLIANDGDDNNGVTEANIGNNNRDNRKQMDLPSFLENTARGTKIGPSETYTTSKESNKTSLGHYTYDSGNVSYWYPGTTCAVYIADEHEVEQGPSFRTEQNANRSTSVSNSKEKSVPTVEQDMTVAVKAISAKEEIAEQWYIIYETKVQQIFKELQEERWTMPDGIFGEIISLVQKIGNVCETLAKEQMKSMCGVLDSVLGDQIGGDIYLSSGLMRVFSDEIRSLIPGVCECRSFKWRNRNIKERIFIREDSDYRPATEPVDQFLLKEFMRQNADLSLDALLQRMKNTEQLLKITPSTPKTSKLLDEFVKLITTIIWYMTIQDKPMVLAYNCSHEDANSIFEPFVVNGGKHKPNKVKGGRIQRVVWPAVLPFEGGRLLRKGVALFV